MPRGIYPRTRKPMVDRFWAKVNKQPGCWLWTGAIDPETGYGKIMTDDQRVIGAHIAAWILTHGHIQLGLDVRHGCHNRACVNPAHLSLGTRAQNMQDMVDAGRSNFGERNPNAKLTWQRVAIARREHADGVAAATLAARFGVSERTMRQCLARETWIETGGRQT